MLIRAVGDDRAKKRRGKTSELDYMHPDEQQKYLELSRRRELLYEAVNAITLAMTNLRRRAQKRKP